MLRENLRGFIDFVRKQGVIALAIGFVLGGSINKVVTAFVNDLINPFISIIVGNTAPLKDMKFRFRDVEILWGDFLSVTIDFLIIALVIYFALKLLKIDPPVKK